MIRRSSVVVSIRARQTASSREVSRGRAEASRAGLPFAMIRTSFH